jgi:hypothetical protein
VISSSAPWILAANYCFSTVYYNYLSSIIVSKSMLVRCQQVVSGDRRHTVDELEQNPARVESAGVRRLGQDDLGPTKAAELYIALFPVNRPGGRADVPDPGPPGSAASPGPPSFQRTGPAVELDVKVPSAQAGKLLRLAGLVVWQASVVGSLFGAAAAHLPPAGTTVVVVLEIVVPPLSLRRRKRERGKRHDQREGRSDTSVTAAPRRSPGRPGGR